MARMSIVVDVDFAGGRFDQRAHVARVTSFVPPQSLQDVGGNTSLSPQSGHDFGVSSRGRLTGR